MKYSWNYYDFQESIVGFKCIIPCAIAKVQDLFEHTSIVALEDIDKNALNSRIREILMQAYRFGFDVSIINNFSSEYARWKCVVLTFLKI